MELVDLLSKCRLKKKIQSYLLEVSHSDASDDDKIAAAKRLTAMGDEEGFNYYANHGFDNPYVVYYDEHWLGYFTGLTTLNFLPLLIALLEQSLHPKNMNDIFRRYDGKVLEALFDIGIQSEENLKKVTVSVEDLIAKSAPDLNYLILWLKQVDFQYKLNL